MPVGGNVPPDADVLPNGKRRHSEIGVEDLVLVNIQKDKQLDRIRVTDLSELFEAGRKRRKIRVQFRRAVNTQAHIVTTPAKLRELFPSPADNRRAVRGTMINCKRCIIRKKQP